MANQTPDQAPIAELDYEPSAFEQTFQKHKSKLILVAILGAIGSLGYYSMKFWKEHQNTKDGLAFFKAETPADYERVAKDLAGRNAGGNALLMVAQAMAEEGKPEEAFPKLQAFLKDYANHPLADLATLRLADALMLSGKAEEAKAALSEVFVKFPKSPHAPLALLRLGDQFASEKNMDEARKQYELIKDKFAGTPYYDTMMKHRDALNRKEPTPVEFVLDAAPAPLTPGGPNGQPGGAPPSTLLNVPSLNPTPADASAGGEKMPLEIPKLDNPSVPPAIIPETPVDPAPAAPATPAPATPAPATPAPATPGPEPTPTPEKPVAK